MNIMQNKTKKFIMQLRHATSRERRNTDIKQSVQYQLVSQAN